jgi:ATP-dependent exoDNAse (exonuclease V) alpha subunit
MTIGFVKSSVAGRSSGKNAVAMAAYRSGDRLVDEQTGKFYDYTKKTGVEHSEIISPVAADWILDRAQLWNRVEAAEKRYDAQVAREIIVAIPRELNRQDKIDLVREYVQSSFVDRGMVVDLNLHHLDGDNPHAHVMMTMRDLVVTPEGVSFGNKNRTWNDRKLLEKQKIEWDSLANGYLERAGIDERIDSRSYEQRGIDDRLPQIHLGAAAASMRERGISTVLGDRYDRIEAINNDIAQTFEQIYNAPAAETEVVTPSVEVTLPKISETEIGG